VTSADATQARETDVCVFAPATLLTITLEQAADGGDELHVHPGGQGVWVARMVTTLGGRVGLCTAIGGETGSVIPHLLELEGIGVRGIPAEGANAAWIQDRRSGERETIWEGQSATLGRHEVDELYSITLAAAMEAGVCVLTGTHLETQVLDDSVYTRLAADLASSGVKVVVDLSSGQLRAVLEAGVHLVKTSDEELVADGWASERGLPQLIEGAERLLEAGAENVVVSRAEDGSVAAVGGDLVVVRAPELEVADTRGAGDSMTGALALALSQGAGWDDTLRLAAAAGATNVTRHGSGSGRPEVVAGLAERTSLERIETAV
jgi:1-phosphofructokinase